MTIYESPFLTTLSEFSAAVAEASMIIKPPSSPFSQTDLAVAVTSVVNATFPRNQGQQIITCPKGYNYCWSHGYVPQHGSNPHSSANCKHKKTGHKDDAIKDKKKEEKHTSTSTIPVQQKLEKEEG